MFKKSPPNDDKVPIITDDSLENEVQNSDQHVSEGNVLSLDLRYYMLNGKISQIFLTHVIKVFLLLYL